jgi:serine/threonine protein phosphatase PrpC
MAVAPSPLRSAARTDVGRKRQINEDALLADDPLGFYVVADGVGGHNKGEVASRETVEQLRMWVNGARAEIAELARRHDAGDVEAVWAIRRLLESAVQSACYMVFGMAQLDPDKKGMSTTCSALLVRGGLAVAAHVGDSRVYRLREREVLQLTEDHTLINYKLKKGLITQAEAEQASGKNVITRAVGHRDYVQVDTADLDALPGDRFLMCTDGLHNYVQASSEIWDLVGEDDLVACAEAAVGLANQRGGKDNITVIVIEVPPSAAPETIELLAD